MVWRTPDSLAVLVAASVWFLAAPGAMAQASADPASLQWSVPAPAGMHHFSIAKGRTVLSVTFIGPYTITYVRVEDAPRPRVFPFGY